MEYGPMSEYNFYAEFDNLFVEHELHGLRDTSIEIINVQMYDPADRDNTDKWVDITDLISDGVRAQLIDQISENYQGAIDRLEAMADDAADARREFALECQEEAMNNQRGVKL